MVTANQEFIIDTRTRKKRKSKHNTKDSHQITGEQKRTKENKRGKKERKKRPTKTNPKQLTKWHKNIHVNNYLKCKWIKCSNQKT